MTDRAAAVQAILFTAHQPVPLKQLAEVLQCSKEELGVTIGELETALAETGLCLGRHQEALRLITAPAYDETVRRALEISGRSELTKPALETLAIIAYRGPIGRVGIEAIRGVNSDATLRNLSGRNLITAEGQPPLYRVTAEFLDHFGLGSTDDLPPIPVALQDEP